MNAFKNMSWLRALPLLALLLMPALQGCRDTIVFAAQREIDVAISVNEDEAEPVYVNVGLDSRMAAIIPAIGEEQGQSGNSTVPLGQQSPAEGTATARHAFGVSNPEGEAASIFSGFYYDSDTEIVRKVGKNPITYDAQIRSQFASGAAAVILADSPKAVDQVVAVNSFTFNRSADYVSPEQTALFKTLKDAVGNLSKDRQLSLYRNPPTHSATSDALIAQLLKDRSAAYPDAGPCEDSDDCRVAVLERRLDHVDTLQDFAAWKSAIEGSN